MSKSRTPLFASLFGILFLSILFSVQSMAPPALAAPQIAFNVNSTADAHDNNPGDGFCIATNGLCTVRAAVEETNALEGMDTINVPAGTYNVDSQIQIDDSLFFNGAGADQTIFDGQGSTPIMRVRTVEILVCDSGNNSVASYRPNGHRNQDYINAGHGGLAFPGSVALNSDGAFVTGYTSGVKEYDLDGVFVDDFFDTGSGAPAGFAPTEGVIGDSQIDVSGRDYYVADYFPNSDVIRVNRFTGAIIETLSHAELQQPSGITFYNEALYVTSSTNDKVIRFPYDDNTETFGAGSVFINSGLNLPRGIVYRDGSFYVANEDSDTVAKFNAASGASEGTFVGVGSGGLDGPTSLLFGPYGDLFVISSNTDDVLRYDGDTGAFKDVLVDGDAADVFLKNPSCLTLRIGAGGGPIVHIKDITLQNGYSPVSADTAGLRVDHGASATLRDSVVTDNDSNIYGGGVRNNGNLEIHDTDIFNNTLPQGFGGFTSTGGGVYNTGHLELHRVGIYNNHAGKGGGLTNADGMVEMTNTTISNNTADGQGGGIRNLGSDAVMWINHSTIVQNEANLPGNGENNQFGGGIFDEGFLTIIGNSIIAENTDNRSDFQAEYSPDCHSNATWPIDSEGRNIIGILSDTCDYSDGILDMIGDSDNPFDPEIGSLFDGYHSLFSFSPALDAGLSTASDEFGAPFFGCRETDQRGEPRPRDGDTDGTANCDIGAYEVQPNYFPAECPTVAGNIIDNYCFEDGEGPWQFFTNGEGNFQTTSGDPFQGEYKAEITIDEEGGNVQLYQHNRPLEPNTDYVLRFAAKSSNGADLSVNLHKHGASYTNYGLNDYVFNLTDEWETYEVSFSTTGFNSPVNDARLRFTLDQFDSDNMTYYIDWVILREENGPFPPIPPDPQPIVPILGACAPPDPDNLVGNSGFEDGPSSWGFFTNGSGSFGTDNSDSYECLNNAVVDITVAGSNVQLFKKNLSLVPNQKYVLRLAARSDSGQNVKLFMQKHTAPYTNYGLNGVELDLTDEWKTFVVEFSTFNKIAGPVNDGRLRIWMAPYDNAGAQFEFDDVVLLTKQNALNSMAAMAAGDRGKRADSFQVQGDFLDGDTMGMLRGAHVPDSGAALCYNAEPSLAELWPADGKMKRLSINGLGDPDSVTITGITQDELTGDTPDGRGRGTSEARLRAERDPFGEGRVYTVAFTAVYGEQWCSHEVAVAVPVRQGVAAVDNGAAFDSTRPSGELDAMYQIFMPLARTNN